MKSTNEIVSSSLPVEVLIINIIPVAQKCVWKTYCIFWYRAALKIKCIFPYKINEQHSSVAWQLFYATVWLKMLWLYGPLCTRGANKQMSVTFDLPPLTDFRWRSRKLQLCSLFFSFSCCNTCDVYIENNVLYWTLDCYVQWWSVFVSA